MKLAKRAALALASVAMLGTVATAAATEAQAVNNGDNWCIGNTSACINAWNGGPWIQLYTGGTTANGDFLPTTDFSGTLGYMEFANGSSPWSGNCIGDAYNLSGHADASLDACPGAAGGNTSGDGWGTHVHFYVGPYCSSGYTAIKDDHWNGWVGPSSLTNGAKFYLNNSNPYCYKTYPPK